MPQIIIPANLDFNMQDIAAMINGRTVSYLVQSRTSDKLARLALDALLPALCPKRIHEFHLPTNWI